MLIASCDYIIAREAKEKLNLGHLLFFVEARIVGGETLRALKLIKLYPVSLVSRVCDQFCLCKFVECDQPLLTFGCAIV